MLTDRYSRSNLAGVQHVSQPQLAALVLKGAERDEQATQLEVRKSLDVHSKLLLDHMTKAMSVDECREAIDRNRLISVRVVGANGGHNILIHGYGQVDHKPALWIADPANGESGWAFYAAIASQWRSCLILPGTSSISLE